MVPWCPMNEGLSARDIGFLTERVEIMFLIAPDPVFDRVRLIVHRQLTEGRVQEDSWGTRCKALRKSPSHPQLSASSAASKSETRSLANSS